jgi:NNP family nitrate/nitrite transporter-like MFS transporter
VLASLFAPGLAVLVGWENVLGLSTIPLALVLLLFALVARNSPSRPPRKSIASYVKVLAIDDAWWFMFLYSVTFGGFVGLASSLPIYFNDQYGLSPIIAGHFTAACVFVGSMLRPVGGALADRIGGIRALSIMYVVAAAALIAISRGLPTASSALAVLLAGMGAFGMGNGAVFQLVPQRFGREIGIITGLVGMTGGVGGFYLASSLGYSKQLTGSYELGFLLFAGLALIALAAITLVKRRWRTTWEAAALNAARV